MVRVIQMTTREKKEVILELKKKLANQELSFLIGAGFSKNVSQSFLNWEELLEDMILEMYQEEIESSFERKKGNTTVAIHRKKKIREIINRVGYLGIASEYVRRKGYHEAIDVYIENRTPYLIKENDEYFLEIRDQKKFISKQDLSVHEKLKDLNVRYIYTFNYDNLLDVICGSNNVEALNIKMLELDETKKKIRQFERYLQQSQEEKRKVDTSPGDSLYNSNGLLDPIHLLEEINKIIEQLRQRNYNLKKIHIDEISLTPTCIKDIDDVISQIDKLREGIEQRIRHNYTVIDCSSKISLTENRKSIFKLHGTIRGREEMKLGNYGFDGDVDKQYIICQEDYDSYAKDHEAFVNLMKIALLRGYFCIIGFSADDPNFLRWLSWVKHIIKKEAEKVNKREVKIFYVDVSWTGLSREKQLLFKNNNIEPVFLSQWYPKVKYPSKMLSLFFEELNDQDQRFLAWEKVTNEKSIDKDVATDQLADIIWSSVNDDRLPSLTGAEHFYRETLIKNKLSYYLDKKINEHQSKILYAAIKGEMLPLDLIKDSDRLLSEVAKINQRIQNAFNLLNIRTQVLLGQKIDFDATDDSLIYEKILQLAFELNYKGIKTIVERWSPTEDHWLCKKLVFLSFFDSTEASEQFDKHISQIQTVNNQEKLYTLEVWSLIKTYNIFEINDQINADIYEEIDQLKSNPLLHSYRDNLKDLIDIVTRPEIDAEPYGTTVVKMDESAVNIRVKPSAQFLQTILEIGISSLNKFGWSIDEKDWYCVFRNIFTRYPYPCLYFSLQYGSDERFMTRIAQDYIYTSNSTDLLSSLLKNMLVAYQMEETPEETKDGILVVSKLFFSRVCSSSWKEHFKKIFNSFDYSDNDAHRRSFNPIYDFFLDGVKLIEDDAFRIRVANRCLEKRGSFDHYDNSLIINAVVKKHVKLDPTTLALVDQLIEVSETSAHFYALINLFEKLKKNQREKILTKFRKLDYSRHQNDTQLLVVICRFSEHISLVKEKIKTIILSSPRLWNTGISGGKVHHSNSEINLITILKLIKCTEAEVRQMYLSMKLALIEIINYRKGYKGWFLFNWKKLLIQMKEFLLNNRQILCGEPDYNSVTEDVELALQVEFGFVTIREAISSDKEYIVKNALYMLFINVYKFKNEIAIYQTEYMLILTKIILKNGPGIQTCFEHVAWVLNEYFRKFDQSMFQPLLKKILDEYQCDFSWQNNKPWELPAEKEVIEKCLQDLYHTYRNWGETIPFWENYKPAFFPATKD